MSGAPTTASPAHSLGHTTYNFTNTYHQAVKQFKFCQAENVTFDEHPVFQFCQMVNVTFYEHPISEQIRVYHKDRHTVPDGSDMNVASVPTPPARAPTPMASGSLPPPRVATPSPAPDLPGSRDQRAHTAVPSRQDAHNYPTLDVAPPAYQERATAEPHALTTPSWADVTNNLAATGARNGIADLYYPSGRAWGYHKFEHFHENFTGEDSMSEGGFQHV